MGTNHEALLQYLLFDQRLASEKSLNMVLSNFSQFRNHHKNNQSVPAWAVQIIVADLVAVSSNLTLIGKGHPHFEDGGENGSNWISQSQPRILPETRVFDSTERTVEYIWDKFYNLSPEELPAFEIKESLAYNFAYCAIPKTKWGDSTFDFSFLTDPFGPWTWSCLVSLILAISLLAFYSVKPPKLNILLLSTFSVLLQLGIGNVKNRSLLFTLWMYCSMIVVNFYTGQMTSEVISPPDEIFLTTFKELRDYNYSFVFDQKYVLEIIQNTVRQLSNKTFVKEILEL